MIDDETKQQFLKELEKSGNVYLSCMKVGIDKSTHYRWLKADKEYKKLSNQAIRHGRENNCDVARQALMINVKGGEMRAIEYLLSHCDPAFKPKRTSTVYMIHKKDIPIPIEIETAEDDVDRFFGHGKFAIK